MNVSNRSFLRSLLLTGIAAVAGFASAQMVPKSVASSSKSPVADQSEKGKAEAAAKRNERARGFIENKGQWPDEALFLGRSNGLNMWVTRDGLRLDAFANGSGGSQGHVVDIRFEGASKLTATGERATPMLTDFIGYKHDAKNAKTYADVVSENVYRGISLKTYFDGSRPRYDFIVSPAAKPDQIRMKLLGAEGFTASGGKLSIKTSVGPIVQQGLAAYQIVNGKQKPVSVAFRSLGKDSFGFKVGRYDASKPLVIDPLIYGSYYGGDSGMDEVHAVVSDLLGGVYMAGSTRSPDFPVIYGPYYFSLNKGWTASDGRDAFVSKLEGDAYRHDYAVYIGGRKDDTADFLQLDQFGNLWVAGYTESAEFPGNVANNNVQYIYYDTLHSRGPVPPRTPGPNNAGRFRVSLPTLGGFSDYIPWNAPASLIQTKIQAYLDIVAPGQTVSVEPTSPNGTVMNNLGMKVTFSGGIKGEMTIDNHLLGAFYTSKIYDPSTGRGQVLFAPKGTPVPTVGAFTLSYAYASNGVNYVATTPNLAFNATPAQVQAALRNMTSPLDPDQTKPLAGAIVSPDEQASTTVLPAVAYVILLPVRVGNWGTIVYNNVSMDRPYAMTKTGVTDIYWDTTSSTPTGPDSPQPAGLDYNADGAAFNLQGFGAFTRTPVPYDTDADLLHDRIQTIAAIGGNEVVIPTGGLTMPTAVMSVVAVKELIGNTFSFNIFNDQVIQGGALGTAPPVVLAEGRLSPTAIYAVRSESRVFLMRFVQDANTSLNPLPSKIFYFGGGVAPKVTGFRIIPHDNPVTGEAIRFAFSGNVSRTEQFLPQIAGSPRANQAGFILRVNYSDSAGFSVVSGSSKYVDAAGTIDGQDYSIPVFVNGIDVDSNANVFVAGTIVGPFGTPIDTSLTDDFGNYVFQTTGVDTTSYLREGRLLRYADGFVRKYSSGGSLTYSVLIGGDGADEGMGVAVDANSNAYMLGRSRSFNYPRTRGVYGETFTQATVSTIAKLNSSATDLVYCTHLRTSGTVTGVGIAVDSRGVAYSTFMVSRGTVFRAWTYDNDPNLCDGFEVVGSIPTTADAVKGSYTQSGGGDYGGEDGGLVALNPSATNILYGTYLGGILDDSVYRPYVDKGGDVWVCGWTDTFRAYVRAARWHLIIRRFQVKGNLPGTMITPLAFRVAPDPNNGFGGSGTKYMPGTEYNNEHDFDPDYWDTYKDRDGYVQRFRIGLTSVSGVAFNPTTIAGGLGASTTGVVTLSQAAPAGGANVVLTMSSSAPASFAPVPSDVSTTSITIPAGSTQGTFTLYSKEVPDNTPVDVTATYQGNFKVGRVVITPWLQSFSITPQEVVGGNKVAGRIQLAFPAGTGGMNVTVNSDKPGIVPVSNVVVNAGQNAQVFDIPTNGVDTDTTVTITASLLGIGKAFQLVVHPAQLKSLTFNPASVTSGSSSTGTLVLNGMAGPTGFNVNLAVEGAPGGYTLSPGTLNFANGQTTKTFIISTPYESATIARVVDATMQPSAGYTPNTVKGTLTVNAVSITDLTITPSTVAGGATASGQITLSAPALAGGAKVDISVSPNDGVVTVPTQVIVPAGQTTFTFSIPTTTTLGTTAYTVTASRGSSSDSATLTVNGLTFGLSIPTVIPGGSSTTGTVALSGPAPIGGIAVTLTSSNPTLLSVAGTVTIPGGQTSVTFPITAQNVTSDTSVSVSAKIGSTTITKSTLVTASKLIGMTINPNYVMNLTSTTITLKLNGPAPSNGLVVNLSNTNPFIVSVPSKVTVPAGKSSYSFTVMTYRVTRTLSATISGISQNNGNASALITVHY